MEELSFPDAHRPQLPIVIGTTLGVSLVEDKNQNGAAAARSLNLSARQRSLRRLAR